MTFKCPYSSLVSSWYVLFAANYTAGRKNCEYKELQMRWSNFRVNSDHQHVIMVPHNLYYARPVMEKTIRTMLVSQFLITAAQNTQAVNPNVWKSVQPSTTPLWMEPISHNQKYCRANFVQVLSDHILALSDYHLMVNILHGASWLHVLACCYDSFPADVDCRSAQLPFNLYFFLTIQFDYKKVLQSIILIVITL